MTDLTPRTYQEFLDELLSKLRSAISGLSTSKASEARLRAEVIASVLEGQSYYYDWTLAQRFPDTASSSYLDKHAVIYGLTRRAATTSEGTVTVTGTPGTVFAAGLAFADAAGLTGETTAGGTIPGGGSIDVDAVSIDTGIAVNWASGEILTFASPPAGIDSTCTASADFTGGADEESDAQLLERLLERIQYPPAGGTESDWHQWALSVDGVYLAYTHPLRRGPGTIDVSIVVQGATGHLALPSAGLLTDVRDYLDSVRPVTTKDFEVVAPDQVLVSVTVDALEILDGYDPATVQAGVETAVEAFFDGMAPGDTLYLVHLIAAIAAVAGVENFTLTAPAADVPTVVDSDSAELCFPDTITVNLA